jgi:nitronate monooxygenase
VSQYNHNDKDNDKDNGFAKLLQRLRYPIIQAPMAGVQGAALAIAVARAGGLGSIPAAMLSTAQLRGELQALKDARVDVYNVNFFCHTPPDPSTAAHAAQQLAWRCTLQPFYREFGLTPPAETACAAAREPFSAAACDVLEAFRPPVVSFHFGLPSAALLARVKGWGACVLSSATTVQEARWLATHGADAVIAQGLEAGGHRGIFLTDNPSNGECDVPDLSNQTGLFALLPQIVAALAVLGAEAGLHAIPVIAAGGIANAAGVRAARALGAVAVQAGSAFLQCDEAATSAIHRAALQGLSGYDPQRTALTSIFTGRPARGIVNRVMRELSPLPATAPAFPTATALIAPLRSHAESQGLGDFSPLWAGQHAAASQPVPAAQVVQALALGVSAR